MRSFQTFETLPRTFIPASDRILWLWLILTESELWRTLVESFLRKVIPKRKIVLRQVAQRIWRSACIKGTAAAQHPHSH